MYKDKNRCKKCVYGWLANGVPTKLVPYPMCLYYHDTGKHRDGNDEYCNSFEPLTEDIKQERTKKHLERWTSHGEDYFY